MDRDTRRLHQNKAERPQVLSRFPSNASGSDGDVVYVKNGTTVSQAIKSGGQWLMIGEGSPVSTRSKSTVTPRTFVIGGGGSVEGAVLQNGSTPFLAVQLGIEPTLDDHLATKSYVDSSSASSGWTMAADSGSNQVLATGNTGTFSGGTGVATVASDTDTLTISIGQAVGTSDAVTFATVNTGQGANELYDMDQNVLTSSAVTFATVDTGQGANELYDMDQNVTTGSSPTFNDLTTDGDILVKGDDISSYPFTSGFVGSGWKIDNTGHAEFANATIRGSLSVFELLMQQLRATNGSVIITAVAKVESISGSDILFEDPSDNGICPFHTNDIVMVQRVNLTGSATGDNGGGSIEVVKRLVRRVTGVTGRTITVTRDGDLPTDTGSFAVGDDVVRIGNTDNEDRDALLYLSADDSKAPYIVIKDGVDSWANFGSADTEKVRLGRLDGITDTSAGLDGSDTFLYGLYSDAVYLKGHINATSGEIAGIKMLSNKLYAGTGDYYNSNTPFFLDGSSTATSGDFSLGDKLKWDSSSSALTITGSITLTNSISSDNIDDVDAYETDQDIQTLPTNSSFTFDGLGDDSPTGTGFFMDANKLGYYTNSAWKTYMGKNGDFGLAGTGGSGAGSLSWDSSTSTLAIAGNIVIRNPGDIDISTLDNDSGFTDDTAADAAQGTANTGVSNAATAQGTANTAVSNAATAQTQADTATSNAATAQTQADTATTNAATAQTTANGRNTSFYQDDVPTSLAAGDIWFDTNDSLKMYRARGAGDTAISGTEWVAVAGEGVGIGTLITGLGVYTGTLTATQVNAVAIDAGSISAGTLTGRTVQTADSGDRIVMDGSANTISLIEGTTSVARVLIDDDDSGPENVTEYETIDTVTLSNQYVPSSGYLESFVTNNYGDYGGRQCQVRINYTIGLAASMILWIEGSTNGSTYNTVYIHPYQSYSGSGAIYLPFMSLQYPYMRIKAQRTGGDGNSIRIDAAYWRVYDSYLELNHSGLNWSGNEIYSKLGPTHLVTGDSTNGRDVLLTRGTAHHYQYGGGGHESAGNPLVISSDESDSYRFHFWFSGADLHIEDKSGNGGYISGSTDYGVLTFTGQHRCIGNSGMTAEQYGEMVGYIVRADGDYNNMSDVDTPTINESLPVIELSDSDNDKRVFGVISSHEDGDSREMPTGSWVTTAIIEEGDERVIVNSLGEGAVWVANINGDLENGDYITTSTAAGLGQKQSDDILHSYTVAKITQDCDFSSGTEFEHDGETYKKQFVGCTYHCG